MLPITYTDPSPSRARYRFERIWLKPYVRKLALFWLPMAVIIITVWNVMSDPVMQNRVDEAALSLRTSVAERPELRVDMVVFPETSQSLQQQILAITGLILPISALDVDVVKIKAAIEHLDAVKSVEVQVMPEGILEIRAVERAPQLVWRDGETLRLIDEEGRRVAVIARRSARGDLPLIVGQSADVAIAEAFAILAAAGEMQARLRGLVRVGERRWDIVLDRGQTIMLPESGPVTALRRVLALHASEDLLSRDVAIIDMRDPSRPVLRLTDTAIAELRRLRTIVRGQDA